MGGGSLGVKGSVVTDLFSACWIVWLHFVELRNIPRRWFRNAVRAKDGGALCSGHVFAWVSSTSNCRPAKYMQKQSSLRIRQHVLFSKRQHVSAWYARRSIHFAFAWWSNKAVGLSEQRSAEQSTAMSTIGKAGTSNTTPP